MVHNFKLKSLKGNTIPTVMKYCKPNILIVYHKNMTQYSSRPMSLILGRQAALCTYSPSGRQAALVEKYRDTIRARRKR